MFPNKSQSMLGMFLMWLQMGPAEVAFRWASGTVGSSSVRHKFTAL